MSFSDYGRMSYEYSQEERDAIINKMVDPIFDRDIFFVDEQSEEVVEVYVNFDSTLPGIEWNYYTFKHVLECYELANDPQEFFGYLGDDYEQYYEYIADDEDIENVKKELSRQTPYILVWGKETNGDPQAVMEGIVAEIKKCMEEHK